MSALEDRADCDGKFVNVEVAELALRLGYLLLCESFLVFKLLLHLSLAFLLLKSLLLLEQCLFVLFDLFLYFLVLILILFRLLFDLLSLLSDFLEG